MTPRIAPSGILPGGIIPVRDYPAPKEPWIELGWPGFEPKTPCFDIKVIDSSGSVMSAQGNDPVGNRFNEARRAIQLVSDWTHTDRSKIAILHFDHPLGASGVIALNDRKLMQRLEPSLRDPGGRGTSDLLPALAEMERLAAEYADHDLRATIFSDFELTDVDPSEVFARLLAFPGQIHAVVLGGRIPPDLVDATNVTVTPLSPGDPPGAFAAAIHRSLTATRRASRYSVLHTPRGREVLS